MKCPYPDCQKDYNDERWSPFQEGFLPDKDSSGLSGQQREMLNRLYVKSRQCHFCTRLFHEVWVGNEKESGDRYMSYDPVLEFLASYPPSKTRFESKSLPQEARDSFHEAERCRSIGALVGASACLRKCIYAVCDDLKVAGDNYREQIDNLPAKKAEYRELLKQVKFLGDNMTKPSGAEYSKEQIDLALEVLPLVLDDIYATDGKVIEAQKILAKVQSKQGNQKP